ncbi:MAG: DNA alkylation repair protein [Candidatus Thorarchaeota archaeon]
MTSALKDTILSDLRAVGDSEQAKIIAGYLKTSKLEFLGVKIPEIGKIVTRHIRGHTSEELLTLMRELWMEPIFESRRGAIDVLKKYVVAGDIDTSIGIIDGWINDMDTWALMDPIGSNCQGELLLRRPELEALYARWGKSDNFWRRRASILPYLYLSLKRNYRKDFAERIFKAIEPHIDDAEFFVGKAAGWVLRELSKREPKLAKDFIQKNREKMTPLVLKEASKKV